MRYDISRKGNTRSLTLRPVPKRGTGGARGGQQSAAKNSLDHELSNQTLVQKFLSQSES